MKHYFLLILVLPLFLDSCKNPNDTDHSLTLEEYRELGMPDCDSVWNREDYSNAFVVLANVKREKPFALPIKDSQRSGVLFYRIISLENLSFLQEDSLYLHEKALLIKSYLSVYDEIIDIYTNILMREQYYNPELVEIWIFGLRFTQKMLDLAHEINESEDPANVRMQSGYPSIQDLYLLFLTDVLEKQQHTSQYSEKDLELLTDSLSSGVRRNMEWFDEDASEKIRQGMKAVIDSTSSLKIKTDYRDLIEIL